MSSSILDLSIGMIEQRTSGLPDPGAREEEEDEEASCSDMVRADRSA